MSFVDQQRAFYRDLVPRQFNRTLEAQTRLASKDAAAKRMLEEMQAVRTSIRVEVDHEENDSGHCTHLLEIDHGRMQAVEATSHVPFMILRHTQKDASNLQRECGASILGFLGAMTGQGDDLKLTSQRVRSLRELSGSLRFQLEGPEGFSLVASFGIPAPESEPRATICVDPDVFAALRSGALDAQEAFLEEKIGVSGDLEMAIGLALAALSPD